MIIGIDPDLTASGVATLTAQGLHVQTLSFVQLVKYIEQQKPKLKKVVIEAGWLIPKSSWHFSKSKVQAERIAKNVGQNHATGQLLEQAIQDLGVTVELRKPIGKRTHEQFVRITGFTQKKRTNQEERDAGLLVWGMAL